jgi:Ca-activated chloride channel family protein
LSFKSPELLLFLLLIPVGIAIYLWLDRRRSRRAAEWSTPALLTNMVRGRVGMRRYIPAIIFGIAVLLLLLGFARPQRKEKVGQNGATLILLMDVSGSMAADDVRPSRLLAADAMIRAFVNTLPVKYRVAVMTFSDSVAVKVSPTFNHQQVIAGLPVKTELEGTAMGQAIQQAVTVAQKSTGASKASASHPPATVVLISDGGSNAGQVTPPAAAAQAKKAGVPVSTIVVGTPQGVVHQKVQIEGSSKTIPLVQQVPVAPATLQAVAKLSGGTFFPALSPAALQQVYKQLSSRLIYTKTPHEVTAALAGAGIVAMLIGMGLSAFWFRRLV